VGLTRPLLSSVSVGDLNQTVRVAVFLAFDESQQVTTYYPRGKGFHEENNKWSVWVNAARAAAITQ